MTDTLYTVVQHSAWTRNQNPQFEHALESAAITERQAEKVRALGGMTFTSYGVAEDYAEAEMYPQGYNGLIPAAQGTFTKHKIAQIEGRPIYVPPAPLRRDRDGTAYLAYYRKDETTGFIWSGHNDDPVQVTREMGEPVVDTFKVAIDEDHVTFVLVRFKAACDAWIETNR